MMQADPMKFVQKCDCCQRFANRFKQLPEELTPILGPWLFAQWGIDIVRPLPWGKVHVKFVIVAIYYFTKWVEAEPLVKISEKNIHDFVWKSIVY